MVDYIKQLLRLAMIYYRTRVNGTTVLAANTTD
jgi:hypothetical protein